MILKWDGKKRENRARDYHGTWLYYIYCFLNHCKNLIPIENIQETSKHIKKEATKNPRQYCFVTPSTDIWLIMRDFLIFWIIMLSCKLKNKKLTRLNEIVGKSHRRALHVGGSFWTNFLGVSRKLKTNYKSVLISVLCK